MLATGVEEELVALSAGIREASELTYMNVYLELAVARDTDNIVPLKSSQLASSPCLMWHLLP